MWVRGLKLHSTLYTHLKGVAPYVGAWIETHVLFRASRQEASHPMWVRGLKHTSTYQTLAEYQSHPMWVRGLKLHSETLKESLKSRTLCGCVD